MSQMDITRKTRDILTYKNNLFLDISSADTDTLALWLYLRVDTGSIHVLQVLSHPLSHLVGHQQLSNIPERISRPDCILL
jgi:hypothetical protein